MGFSAYEGPTFSQWDLAFLCLRRLSPAATYSMWRQCLAIPLLTQPSCDCGKQPKLLTTRTGFPCVQSRRREWLPACSPVAGVHIRIVRRNPPVTDDHNLSNQSERYRTRLGDNEFGFDHGSDNSIWLIATMKKKRCTVFKFVRPNLHRLK